MNDFLDQLACLEADREQAHADGLPALERLAAVARQDSGQARIIGLFLLGLYNGSAYPFDLTQLRSLDAQLFSDCLAALHLDYYPEQEVHEYLPAGNALFAHLRNTLTDNGGAQ